MSHIAKNISKLHFVTLIRKEGIKPTQSQALGLVDRRPINLGEVENRV